MGRKNSNFANSNFNSFFDDVGIGIILLNENLDIIKTNQSLSDLLKYTERKLLALNVREIIKTEDYDSAVKSLNKVFKRRIKRSTIDCRLIDKNKREIVCSLKITLASNKTTKPNLFVLIEDISQKKLKEEQIKAENNLLTALLDNCNDAIYFKDIKSRFIKVSRKYFTEKIGENYFNIIGKTDFDIFGRYHAQQAFNDEQEIIRTCKPIINKEEKEDHRDGSVTWASTTKMPLYDDNKNLIGTFGISRDITRRKRAESVREAVFKIAEAAYTAVDMDNLFQKIKDSISSLMSAKNFYISLCNDKTDTISFTFYVDEKNNPIPTLKTEQELTEYVLRVGKAEIINAKRYLLLQNAGEVCFAKLRQAVWLGVPLRIAGKSIGVIAVYDYENENAFGEEEMQILTFIAAQVAQVIERRMNTEEIKRYVDELKQLNSTKDKFFSIIAHDLRGPLHGLLTFSEMLLEDFEHQPDVEKKIFIDYLQTSMKNLLSLTNNLLTWSQVQLNRVVFEPTEIQLFKSIRSVYESQAIVAANKKIKMQIACAENITAFADQNMVETVIRNLVSNALKFTNPGGKVIIRAFNTDSMVRVEVEDNGMGISPKLAANLFRIDSKVARAGTGNEKGSGLGLIICKEFVERNGGIISVKSKESIGTIFAFTLQMPAH